MGLPVWSHILLVNPLHECERQNNVDKDNMFVRKKLKIILNIGSPGSVVLTVLLIVGVWNGQVECNIQEGGAIGVNTVVHEYETPLLIKNDIIVQEDVTLTLEPGVELRFAPGVTLGVNGTLIAKVHVNLTQCSNNTHKFYIEEIPDDGICHFLYHNS